MLVGTDVCVRVVVEDLPLGVVKYMREGVPFAVSRS